MTSDEPWIFENLGSYLKARLMIASAIIFRKSGWRDWTYGHEKLIGVVLWHCERRGEKRFKYSGLLKRYAYGRTQNYKLLRPIVERNILIKQGNGYYAFAEKYQELIDEISDLLRILDKVGDPNKP
jgi:hypothetical protein